MSGEYTADELFHFVGHKTPNDHETNYEKLKRVLRSNCVSHKPHDGTWGQVGYDAYWDSQLDTEGLIVPSVTCYADIPFDLLSIHTRKYGRFGIGLPKWLLTKFGARPVMYVPMRSDDWQSINGRTLLSDIEAIVKGFNEHVAYGEYVNEKGRTLGETPRSAPAAIAAVQTMLLKDFLAFIKPFDSELPESHPSNFYMEREWRKYGNMKFDPAQVTRLVVANGFKSRMLEEFPAYGDDQVFELEAT